MYDELKEFHELENPSSIDFGNTEEWAWGFGHNENSGFIYHFPHEDKESMYCVAYSVPPFMIEMITNVRNAALSNLKQQLRSLEQQKENILKI